MSDLPVHADKGGSTSTTEAPASAAEIAVHPMTSTSAGLGVWYVEPDPVAREAAISSREALGGWLVDRRWMHRVLDETYTQVGRLADWGHPFAPDDSGRQVRSGVQGPEYLLLPLTLDGPLTGSWTP